MIIAALISGLISVGLHLYLTLQHFQLKLGLSAGQSLCNINATFNCDAVAISPYSMFLGLPIATWGAVTNLVFICFLLAGHFSLTKNPARLRRLTVIFCLFISSVSIVMGLISSVILKTYCLYCMAAYLLSFGSFFFCYKAWGLTFSKSILEDFFSLFTSEKWILGFLLFIPLASFLTNAVIVDSYGLSKIKVIVAESRDNWMTAPTNQFDETNGLVFQKGNGSIKMTIVEFADFKCPHCRMAYPTLHAFAEGRDDVKLIYKAFPLDGVCNPDISRKGDGSTCKLAFAVFCAEKTANKGWKLHHWFFDHQELFLDRKSVV